MQQGCMQVQDQHWVVQKFHVSTGQGLRIVQTDERRVLTGCDAQLEQLIRQDVWQGCSHKNDCFPMFYVSRILQVRDRHGV